ncbi:MAG: TraB/GumN family protein [Saprospiraceae bacterium]|nr:TraB/GumN family protein [Saprospiraceae bacterium]
MGTMHTQHHVPFQFYPEIAKALAQCEVYCGEMNLHEFDPDRFSQASLLPQGVSLESLLGITKFRKCQRIFRKCFNLRLEEWNDRHPFLVMSGIASSILTKDHPENFDHFLWNQASSLGLHCAGLESFDDQLHIMSRISIPDQARNLIRLARKPQRVRRQLFGLMAQYQRQDAVGLYQSTKSQLGSLKRMMLYERNENMAQVLLDQLDQATTFAAVGAAHLMGKYGMVNVLKQRGASVKAIPLQSSS